MPDNFLYVYEWELSVVISRFISGYPGINNSTKDFTTEWLLDCILQTGKCYGLFITAISIEKACYKYLNQIRNQELIMRFFIYMLTLLLVYLKAVSYITISWVLVFTPLFVYWFIIFIFVFFVFIITFLN